MKFAKFLENHIELMPAVNFTLGKPALYQLMRAWNTMAMMHPEKCEDIIRWPVRDMPNGRAEPLDPFVDTIGNPFREGSVNVNKNGKKAKVKTKVKIQALAKNKTTGTENRTKKTITEAKARSKE